jgi:hypothetical protein
LTCSAGCGVGFCILGGCDLVAGSSGCHNTTCATSTCVGGQCVETPRNEGAACTPALSTESCVSSTQGICQAGTCVGLPSNVGGFCVPGEPIPFADDECYSQTRGICDGSGHCLHTLFLGSPCTRSHAPVVQGCSWGQCDIGETGRPFCNINNGGLVTCPRSQACGGPVLEDLVTCECIYPDPGLPSGEPPCQGSEDCCPGQVCICDPHDPLGWCFNKWCWNLADLD